MDADALVARALDRLAALRVRQEAEEQARKDREAMVERAAEMRRPRRCP